LKIIIIINICLQASWRNFFGNECLYSAVYIADLWKLLWIITRRKHCAVRG